MARERPDWKPDLYVVARFLDCLARPGGPPTRTQLQVAARVNWDLLRQYLAFLEARGLVAVRKDGEGTERVALTGDGRAFRDQLREWIDRILGPA